MGHDCAIERTVRVAGWRGRSTSTAEQRYSCKGFLDNRCWRPCHEYSC